MVLRAFRRRLRTIAYYSARQERTVWTRTADVLLLLSPLLAILIGAGLHFVALRAPRSATAAGLLFPGQDGRWQAQLEGRKLAAGEPMGDFDLVSVTRLRGWPFASSLTSDPPTLTVRTLRPVPDAEIRAAIAEALREADRPLEAEALSTPQPRTALRPAALLGNILVAWVVLFFLLPFLIQVLRLAGWTLGEARRFRRRRLARQGRCPNCGFDVRGSVWSANCPECGGLLG